MLVFASLTATAMLSIHCHHHHLPPNMLWYKYCSVIRFLHIWSKGELNLDQIASSERKTGHNSIAWDMACQSGWESSEQLYFPKKAFSASTKGSDEGSHSAEPVYKQCALGAILEICSDCGSGFLLTKQGWSYFIKDCIGEDRGNAHVFAVRALIV